MNKINASSPKQPELGPKNLNTIKKYFNFDNEKIKQFIIEECNADPFHLIKSPYIADYLNGEKQQALANAIFSQPTEKWIMYAIQLSKYISSEEIRLRILGFFSTNPKGIQNACEKIKSLFHEDFFSKILENIDQNGNISIQDENIARIITKDSTISLFLLFHSYRTIHSYHWKIKDILEEKSRYAPEIEAILVWEKENEQARFGFACGGMDKNFSTALELDEKICLINGSIIAKQFHRKGDDNAAKKISYLPARTYRSQNGFVIWENFLYAPTADQHEDIEKAIKNGQKQIHIPNLRLKTVRPIFDVNLTHIQENAKRIFGKSIK